MLVGIIDCDIFINRKTFIPNIEVMLLSAYHKQRGDITRLLINGKNLQMYDKIYIRRNKTGSLKFPPEIYSLPNVDVGGLYFTNGVHVPLDEELLLCEPDISIYAPYVRYLGDNPIKGIKSLNSTQFLSLRKEIPPLFGKRFVIYDDDISTLKQLEFLQDLIKRGIFKKLNFAYPIKNKDMSVAIKWAQQDWITHNTTILCPKVIEIEDMCKIQKEKGIILPISGYFSEKSSFYDEADFDRTVLSALNKSLYCIINNLPLKLILSPKVRTENSTYLLQSIDRWNRSYIQSDFYTFAERKKEREVLDALIKRNPNAKDLIYTKPHQFKNQGGIWLYDRGRN